jgi:hypothetical protein
MGYIAGKRKGDQAKVLPIHIPHDNGGQHVLPYVNCKETGKKPTAPGVAEPEHTNQRSRCRDRPVSGHEKSRAFREGPAAWRGK